MITGKEGRRPTSAVGTGPFPLLMTTILVCFSSQDAGRLIVGITQAVESEVISGRPYEKFFKATKRNMFLLIIKVTLVPPTKYLQ